jgi:hypothetical protein
MTRSDQLSACTLGEEPTDSPTSGDRDRSPGDRPDGEPGGKRSEQGAPIAVEAGPHECIGDGGDTIGNDEGASPGEGELFDQPAGLPFGI